MFISSIIQGITEFLPVSSSLHLDVFFHFFKENSCSAAGLHLGTLVSVMLYFFKDIFKMSTDLITFNNKSDYFNQAVLLIIATIPSILVGFFLKIKFSTNNFKILGVTTIVFAILLLFLDKKMSCNKDKLSYKDAVIIGIFQCLAFIPGVSRLGITISACRLLKIKRPDAVSFSMLLSIPVVLGAVCLSIMNGESIIFTQVLVTAFVGYFVIGLFLSYVSYGSLIPFMIYRIIFGISLFFI